MFLSTDSISFLHNGSARVGPYNMNHIYVSNIITTFVGALSLLRLFWLPFWNVGSTQTSTVFDLPSRKRVEGLLE